ncbi:unnamed protein product [Amoebophrya sp. A120]|nr:unnamed protein product [Amoebophrya sp. A120]|eukprot:GSA120T00001529001.1
MQSNCCGCGEATYRLELLLLFPKMVASLVFSPASSSRWQLLDLWKLRRIRTWIPILRSPQNQTAEQVSHLRTLFDQTAYLRRRWQNWVVQRVLAQCEARVQESTHTVSSKHQQDADEPPEAGVGCSASSTPTVTQVAEGLSASIPELDAHTEKERIAFREWQHELQALYGSTANPRQTTTTSTSSATVELTPEEARGIVASGEVSSLPKSWKWDRKAQVYALPLDEENFSLCQEYLSHPAARFKVQKCWHDKVLFQTARTRLYSSWLALIRARTELAQAHGYASWVAFELAKQESGFSSSTARTALESSSSSAKSPTTTLQNVVETVVKVATPYVRPLVQDMERLQRESEQGVSFKDPLHVYDAGFYRSALRRQQCGGSSGSSTTVVTSTAAGSDGEKMQDARKSDMRSMSSEEKLAQHLPFRSVLPRLVENLASMYDLRIAEVDSPGLRHRVFGCWMSWWNSGWETYRNYHVFQVFEHRKNDLTGDEENETLYSREAAWYGLPSPKTGERSLGFIYVKCFGERTGGSKRKMKTELPLDSRHLQRRPRIESWAPGHVVLHTEFLPFRKRWASQRLLLPAEVQMLFHELGHCLELLLRKHELYSAASDTSGGDKNAHTKNTSAAQGRVHQKLQEIPALVNEMVATLPGFFRDLSFLHVVDQLPVAPKLLKASARDPYYYVEFAQCCAFHLSLYDKLTLSDIERFEADLPAFDQYVRDQWRTAAITERAASSKKHSPFEVPSLLNADSVKNQYLRPKVGSNAVLAAKPLTSAQVFDRTEYSPLARTDLASFWLEQKCELPFLLDYVKAGAMLQERTRCFREVESGRQDGVVNTGSSSSSTMRRGNWGWSKDFGRELKEMLRSGVGVPARLLDARSPRRENDPTSIDLDAVKFERLCHTFFAGQEALSELS